MKSFIKTILFLGIIIAIISYREEIKDFIFDTIDPPITFNVESREYTLKYEFLFIENVDTKIPNDKNDIINMFYSIMNSGSTNETFTCPKEYLTCVEDLLEISNSENLLASINNFIHPFYTYKTIKTTVINDRNVDIVIEHTYTDEMINSIDKTTDEVLESIINDSMSDTDKIRVLHDHIINNAKYDEVRATYDTSDYNSSTAYGPLYEGYAICSGYSDLMSIYLNKLNIPNYRISTTNHIWNLVFVDNKWLHLDLTWDDPISKKGDVLLHNYFLITTDELLNLDSGEHNFDMDTYLEAKN